jgi:AbrB family looped-hinge helix DNA binding protein
MNIRARLSSKGQLVIPKAVRDAHGWEEGMEFEFVDRGTEVSIRPARKFDPRFPPISWEEFERHRIKIDRPFPTDDEIDAAMLTEAKRRFDASSH